MQNDKLIQKMANAYVTACRSLGHIKAAMNNAKVNQYRNQLIRKGIDVPPLGIFDVSEFKENLQRIGIYNGHGSV